MYLYKENLHAIAVVLPCVTLSHTTVSLHVPCQVARKLFSLLLGVVSMHFALQIMTFLLACEENVMFIHAFSSCALSLCFKYLIEMAN
jgi:hypothetical protein